MQRFLAEPDHARRNDWKDMVGKEGDKIFGIEKETIKRVTIGLALIAFGIVALRGVL